MWLIAHDYRLHLWGWTLWRVLVVIGTAYVIFLLVVGGVPDLSARAGLMEGIGTVLARLIDGVINLIDALFGLIPSLP